MCDNESHLRAHLSDGLDGGSVLHQQLHHLHPVLLTGDMQWGEAILSGETQT